MTSQDLQALFNFIPILESGVLKDAHSVYISTGEYQPQVKDLQGCLKQSGLASEDVDWMGSIDQARPFLQKPEDIMAADLSTVQMLVALAAYSEKLNKSFFPHLCSSGFMLMLLKRLKDAHYH
jgi:hypothetical protein